MYRSYPQICGSNLQIYTTAVSPSDFGIRFCFSTYRENSKMGRGINTYFTKQANGTWYSYIILKT